MWHCKLYGIHSLVWWPCWAIALVRLQVAASQYPIVLFLAPTHLCYLLVGCVFLMQCTAVVSPFQLYFWLGGVMITLCYLMFRLSLFPLTGCKTGPWEVPTGVSFCREWSQQGRSTGWSGAVWSSPQGTRTLNSSISRLGSSNIYVIRYYGCMKVKQ